MRWWTVLFCLVVSACGETDSISNRSVPQNEAAPEAAIVPQSRPVRIGELGANFQACSAAGTSRNLKAGEGLPVRSSPFENGGETGSVAAGARFFICTRSHDQKWFGIVFDESGALEPRCGVSEPVTRRRDYDGPCRSGWVQSAFVKVIAGEQAGQSTPAEGENVSGPANSTLPGA